MARRLPKKATTLASNRRSHLREGNPACTIMLSKHPAPAARLAALELQYHVLRITGAELPIRTDNETVTGPACLSAKSRPLVRWA